MPYDTVIRDLAEFDKTIEELGIIISDACLVKAQLDLTREFLHDFHSHTPRELLRIWEPRFDEFFQSMVVVIRLTEAVAELHRKANAQLKRRLKIVLGGSLVQNFSPDQAKDIFYEIELAAAISKAGFSVDLREPDIVVSGNGLSQALGIACKMPSSHKQVHEHISKGYRQITSSVGNGVVSLAMEQLVFSSVCPYLHFGDGAANPIIQAQQYLKKEVDTIVNTRKEQFPSEDQIDGLVLTLFLAGAYGKPAGIVMLRQITLQCVKSNPMLGDLQKIEVALRKLSRESLRPHSAF